MKNNKGYAMVTALIFITAMLLIGTALILMAESNAKQSAVVMQTDRSYYAAESAVQVAAQMYLKSFEADSFSGKFAYKECDTTEEADAFIAAYENGLETSLVNLHASQVIAKLDADTFDEKFELNPATVSISPIYSHVYPLTDRDGNESFFAVACIEGFNIDISAISSTRRVETSVAVSGNRIDVPYKQETIDIPIGSDPDKADNPHILDQNGNIVRSGDGDVYTTFITGLTSFIENIRNKAAAAPNGCIDTTDQKIISGSVDALTIKNAGKSIKYNGDMVINNVNEIATLEYLHVTGNLTITGNVNLSNLKSVYVEKDLIISQNATLNGDAKRTDGFINGSNFFVNGKMEATMSCTLNNCRFYVPHLINIKTTDAMLTGNSVYVAYASDGKIQIGSGLNNIRLGSALLAPQFYAADEIFMYLQGNPSIYALVASLNKITRSNPSTIDATGFWLAGPGNTGGNVNMSELVDTATQKPIVDLLDNGSLFRDMNQRDIAYIDGVPLYNNASADLFLSLRETPVKAP